MYCAAIVPDLPLEESGPWCDAADDAEIETVMLAAPTAPDERLPRIVARSRGFVYAVGLLGVTGERHDELALTALASGSTGQGESPIFQFSLVLVYRMPSKRSKRWRWQMESFRERPWSDV